MQRCDSIQAHDAGDFEKKREIAAIPFDRKGRTTNAVK
jgi:hypothetical protein